MKKLFFGIAVLLVFASLLSSFISAADFQINDLQSFSLIFNNTVYEIEESSGYQYTFKINFTVGSNNSNLSMKAMRISNDGMSFTIDYLSLQNNVWANVYNNGWVNQDYKYIVIKSGEDCQDQWLCNFVNNSVVSAEIVHEVLPNPYQSYIQNINNNNQSSKYRSTINQVSNYISAVTALGFFASPVTNIYITYMGTALSISGVAIAVIIWLKRGVHIK